MSPLGLFWQIGPSINSKMKSFDAETDPKPIITTQPPLQVIVAGVQAVQFQPTMATQLFYEILWQAFLE